MIAGYAGIAYAIGLAVWVVSWGWSWHRAKSGSYSSRTAARMLLLSPVWPIMVIFIAVILVVELWRDADWDNTNSAGRKQ
jgi:H+/Cl- antiporter ClcA